MIPEMYVEEWRNTFSWQTLAQIEQDLIICRALVDLYNNDHIKDALVFRGGTALNKLFLKPASRYSEDIDFVQRQLKTVHAAHFQRLAQLTAGMTRNNSSIEDEPIPF